MTHIKSVLILLSLCLSLLSSRAEAQTPPTPEDQRLLTRGEYTSGEHIGGGLAGTFIGFGVGQFVQGRSGTGAVILGGEVATLGLLVFGAANCSDVSPEESCARWAVIAGAVGFIGVRIWELVDVWLAPARHNQRVRAARMRAVTPWVAPTTGPTAGASGATFGISMRF
jgi:hypothetical protein